MKCSSCDTDISISTRVVSMLRERGPMRVLDMSRALSLGYYVVASAIDKNRQTQGTIYRVSHGVYAARNPSLRSCKECGRYMSLHDVALSLSRIGEVSISDLQEYTTGNERNSSGARRKGNKRFRSAQVLSELFKKGVLERVGRGRYRRAS